MKTHIDNAIPTDDILFYTPTTVKLLIDLATSNGTTPAQLSLCSEIAPTVVSEELEKMVEKGLVEKYEEDKIDNPFFVFHSLTPDGYRKAKSLKTLLE